MSNLEAVMKSSKTVNGYFLIECMDRATLEAAAEEALVLANKSRPMMRHRFCAMHAACLNKISSL